MSRSTTTRTDRAGLKDKFDKAWKVSRALVNNVVDRLIARALVPDDLELPAWVDDKPQRRMIAFRNGLLDVDAALKREARIE
jgi:hypothetical protein